MSNTQTAKKASAKPTAEEKAAAQDAQISEASGADRTFKFDGYEYEILEGQPSPRAMTYIARYAVDREDLAFIPAMLEILGSDQWAAWCQRHQTDQMLEFFRELDKAMAQGN